MSSALSSSESAGLSRRQVGALGLLFLVAFGGFLVLFSLFPVLHDADSYFQLAVARLYAEEGIRPGLEWARFSIMRERFGDKDFLFHVLLIPFATWMDPLVGGRIALALLNAALFTGLAAGALRVAGWWALAVPIWVYVTAVPLFFRLNRLRPEAFAILILLAAAFLASRGRYRALGLVSFIYALSYTAWHALMGLCGLWFVVEWWRTRQWTLQLLVYPLLGIGLGLLVHPQFPANVAVWVHTNIFLPLLGSGLDVGEEYSSITANELLVNHLGWWLGLLVIWRSWDSGDRDAEGGRKAVLFGLAALVFGGLYLLMGRFVTFFVPFATLALFAEVERRSGRLGRWTRLPWRGRAPFALAFSVAILIGVPQSVAVVGKMVTSADESLPMEVDRQAFGASVPPGAKVAATWGAAEWYTFFAPQGRYLNVLDPVFMAKPYPVEYRVQRAIFENEEPDVPLLLKTALDSDFIAVDRFNQPQELADRLVVDPRVVLRYGGYHLLAEVMPNENRSFLLDWRMLPPSVPVPPPPDAFDSLPRYPRLKANEGRRYEAYVDGRRLGRPRGCIAFAHRIDTKDAAGVCLEFAPAGPSRMWVDDRLKMSSRLSTGAELGAGLLLEEVLSPGDHLITVETCVDESEPAHLGFFLLERNRIRVDGEEASVAGTVAPCASVPLRPGAPIVPLSTPQGPEALRSEALGR